MNWFKKRLREPTTFIGIGASAAALGEALKIKEAPQVAEAANVLAQGVGSGMPWWQWGPLAAGAIMGIFMGEKGEK